jgi:hypothetical protein
MTVLSLDPEANFLPSGLKATERTQPVCPFNIFSGFPVAKSQRITVLSADPEANFLPSGLKATEKT